MTRLSARARRAITAVTEIAEALAFLEDCAASRDRYGATAGIQRGKPECQTPGDPHAAALARQTRKEYDAALGTVLGTVRRARNRSANYAAKLDRRRDRHDFGSAREAREG